MKSNRGNAGRWCAVRDHRGNDVIVEALIVDADQKRVRLQTGEHFGEARNFGEYDLMEYIDPNEAPGVLGAVMV